MVVSNKKSETKEIIRKARNNGYKIGFVPTMGALHEGHLSLVRKSISDGCFTVVSIFVNPTQFGPKEDFNSYPKPFEKDVELCKSEGVSLVFAPDTSEMYLPDHSSWVDVEGITKGLCGAFRPGHFRGVTTVVAKLFLIIEPDFAYFGRKDYQQLKTIEKMVADLDFPVKIIGCKTVRDFDGIALSSRNSYLLPDERKRARIIPKLWKEISLRWKNGKRNVSELISGLEDELKKNVDRVEYFSAYDPETLEEIPKDKKLEKGPIFALAVRVGKTRLIDNFQPDYDEEPSIQEN